MLTAAHCISASTGPTTAYRIRAAMVDINSPSAVDVRSNYVHKAPGFVSTQQGKDWALIRLETRSTCRRSRSSPTRSTTAAGSP